MGSVLIAWHCPGGLGQVGGCERELEGGCTPSVMSWRGCQGCRCQENINLASQTAGH